MFEELEMITPFLFWEENERLSRTLRIDLESNQLFQIIFINQLINKENLETEDDIPHLGLRINSLFGMDQLNLE